MNKESGNILTSPSKMMLSTLRGLYIALDMQGIEVMRIQFTVNIHIMDTAAR
uniref:Uncharacterized protein n=1 Tax=Arion vulgaris TaxID=1028688 RepID=A0A0B6Z8B6_9EUPU